MLNHKIERKNACGHHLRDLAHRLLDCFASEHHQRAIFGTTYSIFDLGAWPDIWVSAEFLRAPIPRKGSGSTTTTKGKIPQ